MKKELEIYVHIPFCMKKCGYCDFLSAPADETTQNHYVGALLREIRYYGELCRDREVSTIYIGGGTPSWLQAVYMELILKQLRVSFAIRQDAEISIECNPGTLTREKLLTYLGCGVNRLSIGLQSTLNEELELLGRVHTYEQFVRNYELAREIGCHNINVDLMSALPYQTVGKFLTSLRQGAALKPEHISVYSLLIEKGTLFYDKYKFDVVRREAGMPTECLPSEEAEYEMFQKTKETLKSNGYVRYEVSNYAKQSFECRHNIGYWKRSDYLGLGVGAASLIDNVRYLNTRNLDIYIEETKRIQRILTGEEKQESGGIGRVNLHDEADRIDRNGQMEEFMFLGLRMTRGITRKEFEEAFHMPIEAVYGEVLSRLAGEGLIERREGTIKLTDRGMDISNYVLSQFLMN